MITKEVLKKKKTGLLWMIREEKRKNLPLRLADAVDESLDVRVLFDGLGPVPWVCVGSRLVLPLDVNPGLILKT